VNSGLTNVEEYFELLPNGQSYGFYEEKHRICNNKPLEPFFATTKWSILRIL
jgi:hypothetical protein